MLTIPLFFATYDGHTQKIVRRLAEQITLLGGDAPCINVAEGGKDFSPHFDDAALAVLIAPVRYGKPLTSMDRFIRNYRPRLNDTPYAAVCVNLTARKPEKNEPATNPYLRKWVRRLRLTPALEAVFAGKLDYSLYAWWERHIIRFIMMMTKGPTDLDTVIDYTPWDKVDVFAHQLMAFAQRQSEERRKEKVA